MSLPRYPEYKDSEVEWLGHIPVHWLVKKMGHLEKTGSDLVTGPFGSSLGANDYVMEGIPVIRGVNTTLYAEKKFVQDDFVYISKEKFNEVSRCDARPCDLIFTARGTVGKVGMVPDSIPVSVISPNQLRYRPDTNTSNPTFFFYLFSSVNLINEIELASESVAQPNLNLGSLKSLKIPLPCIDEQLAIATFLDRETGKIDALIAEQEKLLTLLAEKRQATISHAVTKGLNPAVPMKDSGVEWLGEVPEHWEVSRVKYYCSVRGRIGFRGYTTEDQVNEGDGALVLGATQITNTGQISLEAPVYISWEKYFESPEIMVESGDVLMVQRGSTCGKVGFVSADFGATTINPSIVLLKEICTSPRLLFLFLSSSVVQNFLTSSLGKTAIPMLSQEQIGNLAFCVPPKSEQVSIIEFVQTKVSQLDSLTTKAELAIELLKERRSALISAAVTGKIDVRQA